MTRLAKTAAPPPPTPAASRLADLLPAAARDLADPRRDIPRLARDRAFAAEVERALPRVPTAHRLHRGDSRQMTPAPGSVHPVVTSPPYWTLEEYNRAEGQLGHVADYGEFLDGLDEVWRRCFDALAPGGRLACVVGDVCLSRRRHRGRHAVAPFHAAVQEWCRAIGFDNLTPIIRHEIASASHEAEGNGPDFLGRPYEPNAVIKHDVEFVLMQRKPGGYAAAHSRPLARIRPVGVNGRNR